MKKNKGGVPRQSMLIIEHSTDGVYFYLESEKHFKAVNEERQKRLEQVSLEDLVNDCYVPVGRFLVIPLMTAVI